jgi:hypothetical protein
VENAKLQRETFLHAENDCIWFHWRIRFTFNSNSEERKTCSAKIINYSRYLIFSWWWYIFDMCFVYLRICCEKKNLKIILRMPIITCEKSFMRKSVRINHEIQQAGGLHLFPNNCKILFWSTKMKQQINKAF